MYRLIEAIVAGLCLCGILYFSKMRKSQDASSSREEIINYFKEQKALKSKICLSILQKMKT